MVIAEIVFKSVFGLPMIAWGGMFTFLVLVAAAYAGATKKPLKVHKGLAIAGLVLGLLHGLIGLLAFLGL